MTDRTLLESRICGAINAKSACIGKGVVVEKGVLITGRDGPAESVVLKDFCFIGTNTKVIVPRFTLGEYTKLHNYSFLHGEESMSIGNDCWIGGNVVLDSNGGLEIEDNVGIGAHSQVWTHIQFGDIVQGCRFHSRKRMKIGKDAWFVGHCVVSPVEVGERSMALLGSVVTKDMLPDHVYAGVPAKDVTCTFGQQFECRSVAQKAEALQQLIDAFVAKHPRYKGQLRVITDASQEIEGVTCFDVAHRTYTKNYNEGEILFLKSHVPLVKFRPDERVRVG